MAECGSPESQNKWHFLNVIMVSPGVSLFVAGYKFLKSDGLLLTADVIM